MRITTVVIALAALAAVGACKSSKGGDGGGSGGEEPVGGGVGGAEACGSCAAVFVNGGIPCEGSAGDAYSALYQCACDKCIAQCSASLCGGKPSDKACGECLVMKCQDLETACAKN